MKEDKKTKYDNYICFVLGADAFKICETIRTISASYGIDTIYEKCKYIAVKFAEYDKKENKNISTYDSLAEFLTEHEKQIEDFLLNNIDIKV